MAEATRPATTTADPTHRACVFAWFGTTAPTGTGTSAPVEAGAARGTLVCPECGAAAQDTPPHAWSGSWGPRPSDAHRDGSPLCPVPVGYHPADPIPTRQARAARVVPRTARHGPVPPPPPSGRSPPPYTG